MPWWFGNGTYTIRIFVYGWYIRMVYVRIPVVTDPSMRNCGLVTAFESSLQLSVVSGLCAQLSVAPREGHAQESTDQI